MHHAVERGGGGCALVDLALHAEGLVDVDRGEEIGFEHLGQRRAMKKVVRLKTIRQRHGCLANVAAELAQWRDAVAAGKRECQRLDQRAPQRLRYATVALETLLLG